MPRILHEVLQETANQRGRSILVFVLPEQSMANQHVVKVESLLRGQENLSVDMLVHSRGGSAHSAYLISALLQGKSSDWKVLVPLLAKSAATLLCLGAHEIILGDIAQLGPLDTQIEEITKGVRKPTSALNPSKALERLTEFSTEAMDVMTKLILSRAEVDVADAIKFGIEFSTRISEPLFQQLDPVKIGQYSRALSIGYEYGLRLLMRNRIPEETARQILDKLIYGYPAHEYIIDAQELTTLSLPARTCGDDCYGNIHEITDALIEYLQQSPQTVIDLIRPTSNIITQQPHEESNLDGTQ